MEVKIFQEFLKRMVLLQDLAKLSSQTLSTFQQNLEVFRRPPVDETSPVVARVFAECPSSRLTKYKESGCRHVATDREVIETLNTSLQSLRAHILQAKEYVDELELIVEDANKIIIEDLGRNLARIGMACDEDDLQVRLGESDCLNSGVDKVHRDPDYLMMISLILLMLVEDYNMQEKILSDLDLQTPSEVLQNYCLMWLLHPFIEDSIIDTALSWV